MIVNKSPQRKRAHRLRAGIIFVIGVFCLMLQLRLPVFGQEETIYGLITEDGTEVRVGPDFAYASIGQLPKDASVVVLGRAGDFYQRWDGRQWIQIKYGSSPAWVYARLVRTSIAFNSIFPTGRLLPRDANGRTPDGFDLSSDVCSQWRGDFSLTGNFMAGDSRLTVTYPALNGTSVYSVIVIAPSGDRRAFDNTTNTTQIDLNRLPIEGGTYTWRVAPYWTDSSNRYGWQQICLLQTGGTFEKPYTGVYAPTATPTQVPGAAPTATPWSPS